MKQLKALEILKECKNYAELWSVEPLSKEEYNWITDIDEAISELEALQEPKTCFTCHLFEDSSCTHPEVEDFYTPDYINHSGCGLHQPIPKQPESKDDPAI